MIVLQLILFCALFTLLVKLGVGNDAPGALFLKRGEATLLDLGGSTLLVGRK